MRVPGCGSNVSSWLGPPCSQSRMIDWAWSRGLPGASAARASRWPTGVSQAGAGEAGQCAGSPRRVAQWFHENSVELISAQKRSSSCWVRVQLVARPATPRSGRPLRGRRPAGQDGEVGGLHRRGSSGAIQAMRVEALNGSSLIFSRTISPFISSSRCGIVPARPSNSSSPVSP